MDEKIIQIMPIDNYWVEYLDDDAKFYCKIIALGLTDEGEIIFLDSDDHGIISDVTESGSFSRVFYSKKDLPEVIK